MSRCSECGRWILPLAARGPRLLGPLHRRCWVAYYQAYLDAYRTGRIPNTRAIWDAMLMAPKEISDELLRRYESQR